MRGRELPPYVGWGIITLVVIIVGYILWNAGGVRPVQGGKPTARDLELLKGMAEAQQRAGIGQRQIRMPMVRPNSDTPQQPSPRSQP
jgi:hypothetical protein